ncbi:unnamed protein product, partial [Amoebophrya sp. A25]
ERLFYQIAASNPNDPRKNRADKDKPPKEPSFPELAPKPLLRQQSPESGSVADRNSSRETPLPPDPGTTYGSSGAAADASAVISFEAYKNAVRDSPEFLELIGLIPPWKPREAAPPRVFHHNNQQWRITNPQEFWSLLLELRDEVNALRDPLASPALLNDSKL